MRTALGGRFAISAGRVAALPAASICPRCWYLGSSDDSWRVWGLWGGAGCWLEAVLAPRAAAEALWWSWVDEERVGVGGQLLGEGPAI